MLLFIPGGVAPGERTETIQIHLMLLFIQFNLFCSHSLEHSNTSHVIVYHYFHPLQSELLEFKYISCYCLSKKIIQKYLQMQIQIHLMLLFIRPERQVSGGDRRFKYISCYCLSESRAGRREVYQIQIHLMLLFIRLREGSRRRRGKIQIHLMLLFILFPISSWL